MLNLGYFEVAYNEKNHLKITEAGKKVLFGKERAQLVVIAKEEKVVKHFGNTGSLGKKIPRHNQENISKEAIAKDLEIDENIFEDDK